mmetsp:Transcript_15715/g.36723  ORF Transcript_15715/g.36723 Transcript_15715/m.36723 type:complete len:116 (+) Transcript_15715:754-1101(+)
MLASDALPPGPGCIVRLPPGTNMLPCCGGEAARRMTGPSAWQAPPRPGDRGRAVLPGIAPGVAPVAEKAPLPSSIIIGEHALAWAQAMDDASKLPDSEGVPVDGLIWAADAGTAA